MDKWDLMILSGRFYDKICLKRFMCLGFINLLSQCSLRKYGYHLVGGGWSG